MRLTSLLMLVNVVLRSQQAFRFFYRSIETQPAQTLALLDAFARDTCRGEPFLHRVDSGFTDMLLVLDVFEACGKRT